MLEITLQTRDGLRQITDRLAAYRYLEEIDLSPLIPAAEQIVRRGRERMTRDGTGSDGERLAEIRPETVARRARRRDGQGPPLAPNDARSRVNRNHLVTVTAPLPGDLLVETAWTGADWLYIHAEQGVGRDRTIRDVLLPDPETRDELRALVLAHIAAVIAPEPGGLLARLRGHTYRHLRGTRQDPSWPR